MCHLSPNYSVPLNSHSMLGSFSSVFWFSDPQLRYVWLTLTAIFIFRLLFSVKNLQKPTVHYLPMNKCQTEKYLANVRATFRS